MHFLDCPVIDPVMENSGEYVEMVPQFNCNLCPRKFFQKQDLYVHIKDHFKPIVCKLCEKTFVGDKKYVFHMQSAHKITVEYTEKDSDIKADRPPKLMKCPFCREVFQKNDFFKLHIESHPLVILPFVEDNNVEKISAAQTNNKLFICDLCKKTFTKKGNLSYHLNIHSGNHPFACNECDKTFAHKAGLINHKRRHTGDQPYPCPYCDRRFGQSTDLRRHRRSHGNEEKPFACNHCDLKFYENKFLKAHLKCHKAKNVTKTISVNSSEIKPIFEF